jgi:hypothetical protein
MLKLRKYIFTFSSSAPQIIVNYQDLVDGKNLKTTIEQAYGPRGIYLLLQASAFYLLKEYLAILKQEWQHYHCSIN